MCQIKLVIFYVQIICLFNYCLNIPTAIKLDQSNNNCTLICKGSENLQTYCKEKCMVNKFVDQIAVQPLESNKNLTVEKKLNDSKADINSQDASNVNILNNKRQLVKRSNDAQNYQQPMSEGEYLNMKNSGFGGRDESFSDFASNTDQNNQQPMSESEYIAMKNSGFGGRDESFPDFAGNVGQNYQQPMSEGEYLNMKNSGFGGRDESFPDFSGDANQNNQQPMSEAEYIAMKNSGFGGRDETFEEPELINPSGQTNIVDPNANQPANNIQTSDSNSESGGIVDQGTNNKIKPRFIGSKFNKNRKRNQPNTQMSESEYLNMKNSGFGGRDESFGDFNNYQYDYQDQNVPKTQMKRKRSKLGFKMPASIGKSQGNQQALGQQADVISEIDNPKIPNLPNTLNSNPNSFSPNNPRIQRLPNFPPFSNNERVRYMPYGLNRRPDKRADRNGFLSADSSHMFAIIGVIVFMIGALLTALFWYISKPKKDGSKHSKKKRKSGAAETENLVS